MNDDNDDDDDDDDYDADDDAVALKYAFCFVYALLKQANFANLKLNHFIWLCLLFIFPENILAFFFFEIKIKGNTKINIVNCLSYIQVEKI